MERRETRKSQVQYPSKLIPIQSNKADQRFCSLAELKTCLDSAQVSSFKKESKTSILKLLDAPNAECEKRCALWKASSTPWRRTPDPAAKPPSRAGGSSTTFKPYHKNESFPPAPKKLAKQSSQRGDFVSKLSSTVVKPCTRGPVRSDFNSAARLASLESTPRNTPAKELQDDTSLSGTDIQEDYNSECETSWDVNSDLGSRAPDGDEFEELSDIDGDDSVVTSHTSTSWASLEHKPDEVSESVTTTDSGVGSEADITTTRSPITNSLFKHCPPVLYFPSQSEKVAKMPRALGKQLKWKMSTITPNVVKNIIAKAGFVPSTRKKEWIGYWGKHMKPSAFRNVLPHQKVNHFPGTFEIGRKDKLWKNLSKAQLRHTKKEYDFLPLTFCLPSEWKNFKRFWDETGHKQKWIIKPPASARGIGIKVVHKINQIPRKRSIIIQRYLANPFLINGRKFDLRLYVYVSSYDPLVVYLYDNGLVRFASSKYSYSSKSLSNRFVHLTNYSVNKNNTDYIRNADESGTESHKWGLKALWKYLHVGGYDVEGLKAKIKTILIKTIIASVPTVTSLSKSHCRYRHSCHELFGFDIFLDHNLKPWLFEVNISPSLHTSAPLDKHIKYGLIKDLFNTAGFLVPESPRAKSSSAVRSDTPDTVTSPDQGSRSAAGGSASAGPVSDAQLYFNPGILLSSDEKAKHAFYSQRYTTEPAVMEEIVDKLTPDDMRVLMKHEDEMARRGDLELIYPEENSLKYLKYFPLPKFYDLLLIQWRRKYAREPGKGVLRLQRLAETQAQFNRQSVDHVWGKQKLGAKRSEKPSTKKNRPSSLSSTASMLRHDSATPKVSQLSMDAFVRKGVTPVTYKPPLPVPHTTRQRISSVPLINELLNNTQNMNI